MKDIALTKRQILFGFLLVFLFLLPKLLFIEYKSQYLALIAEWPGDLIYIFFVVVLFSLLEKHYPIAMGKFTKDQQVEKSPFVVYFFFGSFGLLFLVIIIFSIYFGNK